MKPKYPRLRWQGTRAYYDHGGKPRRSEPLGKDFAAIMRRYAELEAGQRARSGTTAELIAQYLARPRATSLSAYTLDNYRRMATQLTKVFGHIPPGALRRRHVLEFVDRHRAPQMARNCALFMKQILEYGIERDIIQVNPLAGMRLADASRRDRYLTDAEFDTIRAELPPYAQVAVDLAYLLGMRRSDLCALRWSDIRDGQVHFRQRKTGKAMAFRITPEVQPVLDRARTLAGALRALTVICTRRGQPIAPDTLTSQFYKAARRAGVPNARLHDVRAKSASDDAQTAQARLGHDDQRNTARYLRRQDVIEPLKTRRKRAE